MICKKCNGEGERKVPGTYDAERDESEWEVCGACEGTGRVGAEVGRDF